MTAGVGEGGGGDSLAVTSGERVWTGTGVVAQDDNRPARQSKIPECVHRNDSVLKIRTLLQCVVVIAPAGEACEMLSTGMFLLSCRERLAQALKYVFVSGNLTGKFTE